MGEEDMDGGKVDPGENDQFRARERGIGGEQWDSAIA
jgi:hypothetical protein